MNREQWKRHRKVVLDLFMAEWDPLGLDGALRPRDEYDAYAMHAWKMAVVEGRPVADVAAYLVEVETEAFGLPARPDVARRIAETLVAMRLARSI